MDQHLAVEKRVPGEADVDALGDEPRRRVRRQAVDAEILEDELAARDVHAEAADVHRPLEPVAARGFRALTQRGAEVDGDDRNQRRRECHGNDRDSGTNAAVGRSEHWRGSACDRANARVPAWLRLAHGSVALPARTGETA